MFFLRKKSKRSKKLIAGPTVFVCDECVELCMDIIKEDSKNNKKKLKKDTPKPSEVKKFLDDFVIGQSKAKKILSVAATMILAELVTLFGTTISADPLLAVFSNNTIGKETPPSVDNKIVTFWLLTGA